MRAVHRHPRPTTKSSRQAPLNKNSHAIVPPTNSHRRSGNSGARTGSVGGREQERTTNTAEMRHFHRQRDRATCVIWAARGIVAPLPFPKTTPSIE